MTSASDEGGTAAGGAVADGGAGAGGVSPIWFVVIAVLLWSTGGLFIKWGTLSDVELSGARALFAAVTVLILTRREGFGLNLVTAVAAVFYAALLYLFVRATLMTTAANAIFLQYTAPVYILLAEPFFFKEKYRAGDFVVVAFCVIGMALFFVGQLRPQDVEGNFLALGSGFCFAVFFLLLRHPRAREVNRASSVIYGNLLLAFVMLVTVLAVPGVRSAEPFTAANLAIAAYLGIVQLGVAYTLLTLGVARGVKSLDAGIIGYIEPVLNPVWVFLFLGERPARWALVGGAIIIAAVASHTVWAAKKAK
ncbi:MAG TPA: EamA family transporter [Pyrinomonadaceae bacterium]|nr:EamA family transporter [Pyrinomonadaceae bacterium]